MLAYLRGPEVASLQVIDFGHDLKIDDLVRENIIHPQMEQVEVTD
jgi:hypothetical protein